jgi:hypothetical protein
VFADFRNREQELKNALATFGSKVRDLELKVREIEAGAWNSSWLMRSHLVGALKPISKLF